VVVGGRGFQKGCFLLQSHHPVSVAANIATKSASAAVRPEVDLGDGTATAGRTLGLGAEPPARRNFAPGGTTPDHVSEVVNLSRRYISSPLEMMWKIAVNGSLLEPSGIPVIVTV